MDSNKTELPTCNICGASDSVLLFSDTILSDSLDRGIVRCSHCGLVYRNIRKAERAILDEYSSKEYPSLSPDWIEGRKDAFRPYLKMLSRFRKSGNVLDVGAGHGFFLSACEQEGWNCIGVEPSLRCRQFAKIEFGMQFTSDAVALAVFEEDYFDVITFWNALAHLRDPMKMLLHVYRLLRPGGVVVVRTPNADFHVPARRILTNCARIIPKLRSLDHTVFHLYSFGKNTILRMLRDVGFEDTCAFPAGLSWTTTYEAKSSLAKKLIVVIVEIAAKTIYFLTARRLLVSPSILVMSIKPDECASDGDREKPHGSPLPHHRSYGSVSGGSADQAERGPGKKRPSLSK